METACHTTIPTQPMPPITVKDYLRPAQVEEEFSISVQMLEKLRSEGCGPTYFRRRRMIWYHRADVAKWIEAGRVKTAG